MTVALRYLVDGSAWARTGFPEVATVLEPLMSQGLLATCTVVELEVLRAIRDPTDSATLARHRRAALVWLATGEGDLRRALETQALLAERRLHQIAWSKLVIAAVAERNQVTVLHDDTGYDPIGGVSGQRMEWVVPESR